MVTGKRCCHNGCRLSRAASTLQDWLRTAWMAMDKSVKCLEWPAQGSGFFADALVIFSKPTFWANGFAFWWFSASAGQTLGQTLRYQPDPPPNRTQEWNTSATLSHSQTESTQTRQILVVSGVSVFRHVWGLSYVAFFSTYGHVVFC